MRGERMALPSGESISPDFKILRMLLPDTIRPPSRVANFADEMAGRYINLYDDDWKRISTKGAKKISIMGALLSKRTTPY